MGRDLVFGITFSFGIIWLTFFGTPGSVEVATLVVAVVALIWFATVPAERLVDTRRRPHVMLFGLTMLGSAVVLVAASLISTGTLLLVGAVTIVGVIVGLTRAVRFGLASDQRER